MVKGHNTLKLKYKLTFSKTWNNDACYMKYYVFTYMSIALISTDK